MVSNGSADNTMGLLMVLAPNGRHRDSVKLNLRGRDLHATFLPEPVPIVSRSIGPGQHQ